ncbi:hypothetical protein C8035_v006392 [Colletotrichum spinosum]|uniref:Uncharacterized protein n=1 Tax=Colletotrichum spinosum TaxID=1347390 RepID=A0A4V3HQV3_9PEZI|nr:hypothetical protein C8035_v006392 [Colletotrichum spinosum]
MNIDFIKLIDNYKNYNSFHKGLKGLFLYKNNFTILSSLFKIIMVIFNFNI